MPIQIPKHRGRIRRRGRPDAFLVIWFMLIFVPMLGATPIMNSDFHSVGFGTLEMNTPESAILAQTQQVAPATSIAFPLPSRRLRDPSFCSPYPGCFKTMQAPEPTSFVLVGSGILTLSGILRRRLTD